MVPGLQWEAMGKDHTTQQGTFTDHETSAQSGQHDKGGGGNAGVKETPSPQEAKTP